MAGAPPAPGRSRRGRGPALVLLAAAGWCAWSSRGGPLTPTVAQVPAPFDEGLVGVISEVVEEHALKASVLVCVLCFMVANTEPPPSKAASAGLPLDKRPDYNQVLFMSAFLSFLSGTVNAIAIIEMGGTVSHHTGNASHTGRLFGIDATRFAVLMLAFALGAAVQGYCKSDGEAVYCGRYSPGLLGSALAVAGGAAIEFLSGNKLVSLPLLAFSQGLQNAITRKCSSLPVCTTHMTGYLTDAGSGLGAWLAGREPLSVRTKFFLFSLLAFIVGGHFAKMMLDAVGVLAALVPATLMAVTALGWVPLGAVEKDS